MDRNRYDLTSCAVCINGQYIEDLVEGYSTLRVSGRDALTKIHKYDEYRTDGAIFDYGKFPVRDIVVKYVIEANSPEALREKNNQLVNLLNQDDADVQFNDEFDKFFIGSISVNEPSTSFPLFIEGSYTIRCFNPFKYSTAVKTALPNYNGNTASFVINYQGSYPARPVLQAEFAGALSGGTASEDGDCGYIAFMDEDKNIIQLGNPEAIDLDASSKADTLVNHTFEASASPFTGSGVAVNQSITDAYWNKGAGQTLKYVKQQGVG